MTAPKKHPMSRKLVAQLGGMARAAKAGPEGMSLMGYQGAMANIARNGADQPLRALAIARGHSISSIAPSRRSSAATGSRREEPSSRGPVAGRELDHDPAPIPPSGGGRSNPDSPRHLGNSAAGRNEKAATAANSDGNGYHGRF